MHHNYSLNLSEVLIALSICSVTNPTVGDALKQLEKLKDCEAHSSHTITNGELKALSYIHKYEMKHLKYVLDNLSRISEVISIKRI